MNPRLRRHLITLAVMAVAGGVVLITFFSQKPSTTGPQPTPATQSAAQPSPPQGSDSDAVAAQTPDAQETDSADEPTTGPAAAPVPPPPPGLSAAAPSGDFAAPGAAPRSLGSLDPRRDRMLIEFKSSGAGIERIVLSDLWLTASAKRQADDHHDAVHEVELGARAAGTVPPLPPDDQRYVLQTAQTLTWTDAGGARSMQIGLFAAHSIEVGDQQVVLVGEVWTETGPGRWETRVVDEDGRAVLDIVREFVLAPNSYEITIRQRVLNLLGRPLQVRWVQYGPSELLLDRARYMDRRRFRFGYLDPQKLAGFVYSDDNDLLFERQKLVSRAKKANLATDPQVVSELETLWPNKISRDKNYELSWFAPTNRYFALAIHAPAGDDGVQHVSLADHIERIQIMANDPDADEPVILTSLFSPPRTVTPNAVANFDLGVYAGPLDRNVLDKKEPFVSLKMRGLILYQMSAMCAICTFQWLANFLLWFLSGVHWLIGDWGLAIIILVVVVRTLLHPITKRSQIQMQRAGKVMGDIKPEIEKLQKKYKDDPKKQQQEQMRLMRERGVNPLGCVGGMLPMFLQMPIWVALYAMLYFAFELRHQPAVWGFFQLFWDWPFLADLSSADHCFWEFDEPFKFLMWNVTGINFLPILMGLVFFIQQKYMAPPPSPSMTKEQLQQQKIMKVMMVVLFPVMLYSAPSGLTLYIFTSSLIGIIESRYIRRHISEMDLKPPSPKPGPKRKPKDPQARAFADAIARAKAKRRPPPKRYKKRKD